MKNFYMKEDWEEGNETFFFELDHEGTVTRQIIKKEDQLFASNRPDFCLSDTRLDFIEALKIQKQECEDYWTLANKRYMDRWGRIVKDYVMGMEVEGFIEVIYPQGIIFSIGDSEFGIADYEECRKASGIDRIYPKNRIKAKVSGYDHVNLWVIVENAEVVAAATSFADT